MLVSIPQAVGTIAMLLALLKKNGIELCFNTASGRYYCNQKLTDNRSNIYCLVSIPQAVGTIAIGRVSLQYVDSNKFQYRKR